LGPKGSYTHRDVDADEENLKKTILDHTECLNWPKKTLSHKLGYFPWWFLCSSGSYALEYTVVGQLLILRV
jgi:hypothetical protein